MTRLFSVSLAALTVAISFAGAAAADSKNETTRANPGISSEKPDRTITGSINGGAVRHYGELPYGEDGNSRSRHDSGDYYSGISPPN